MTAPSKATFIPDEALAFRSIGSPTITTTWASAPQKLSRLIAFWSTDEWGMADRLTVVTQVNHIFFGSYDPEEVPPKVAETYKLSLQVDADPAFSSPITVASIPITDGSAVGRYIELAIDPDDMAEFDKTAKYVRFVAALDGEAPALRFSAYVRN